MACCVLGLIATVLVVLLLISPSLSTWVRLSWYWFTSGSAVNSSGLYTCAHTGGSPARVEAARAIVEAGVAVMGHVGLTPQSVSVIGAWLCRGEQSSFLPCVLVCGCRPVPGPAVGHPLRALFRRQVVRS